MVKGSLSDQQLVCQDSYRPNIHEVIIGLALQDLGADVIQSAAVGGPPVLAVGGPSEIAELVDSLHNNHPYIGEHDVLRLYVTVQDILVM